jgi:uncharacterized membrane protein
MSATKLQRWSPPADAATAVALAAAACALFATSWSLLHGGFWERDQIVDTPVYQRYGDRMETGDVPYRDFRVEYPPGVLPVFAAPSLVSPTGDVAAYTRVFELLMLVCGLALVIGMTAARAGPAALAVAALAPIALGNVVLTRFDLLPAALTAFALAALLAERHRAAAALLGVGIVVKLYPAVLVPIALAWAWQRRGRREAQVCAAIVAGVVAVAFVPFLVLAPHGFLASFSGQLSRPLQIETLGAAALLASPLDVVMSSGHGSQNVAGTGVWAVAILQSLAQVGALVWIWIAFARRRLDLVTACAAAVAAFVCLGKVLSPQFLVWLVPLVPLVRGRRGVAATALLAVALVLTQLWFPYRYWDYVRELDGRVNAIVLARDLVLVALLVVLLRPRRAPARSA